MRNSFETPQKIEATSKKEKPLWKKIVNLPNAAILFAMLKLADPSFAGGQEANGAEKAKENMKAAKDSALKVASLSLEKGRAGKIGETAVRELQKEGEKITVGFDKQGKPAWIIEEGTGAKISLMDADMDGVVDRVIFNNSGDPANRKSAFNKLNHFTKMDELANSATVGADLLPEDVRILEFGKNENKTTAKDVNFKDGTSGEMAGSEAEDLFSKAQRVYAGKLKMYLK